MDWLLIEQRKLYARSYEDPDHEFRKLWGLMTDLRNLRLAFGRVARNRGRRTAGVDGFTVRSVVAKDAKVNRLVVAFLKAGVMAEEQFFRSSTGTPQGGILSPLLANIALSVIDERYERYLWPRRSPSLLHDMRKVQLRAGNNRTADKRAGNVVLFPVRYADDFIILVGARVSPDNMNGLMQQRSWRKPHWPRSSRRH